MDEGSILHAQMVSWRSWGSQKEPRKPRERARGRPGCSGRSPRRVQGAPQRSPGTVLEGFWDLCWDMLDAWTRDH